MLAMYFKRTTRLLTVGRNGVRVPELQMYFDSEQLNPHQKEKIHVRYNTDDVREVYCFSKDDEFICTARSVALGNLSQEMTAQNMRELNNKKKQLRRLAKQHIPDIAVPSTQQLAMASGKYFDKPDLKVLPSVIQFDGEKQRKAEIIQNAEQQLHTQPENQRDEDEALYKFMTGG